MLKFFNIKIRRWSYSVVNDIVNLFFIPSFTAQYYSVIRNSQKYISSICIGKSRNLLVQCFVTRIIFLKFKEE